MTRSRGFGKFLGSLVFVMWILVMSISVLYVVKARLDGGVPAAAGYKMFLVSSGSLHPVFKAGSVIAVKDLDSRRIRKGDIITFKDPADETRTITRRVLSIAGAGDQIQFITSKNAKDRTKGAVVPAANLVGRVDYWVPYLGYILELAVSKIGLVMFFIIPGMLLIISEVRSLLGGKNEYGAIPTRHETWQ